MSKADISTTLIRSRRAVLAGIASAAAFPIAAAIPTAAPATEFPVAPITPSIPPSDLKLVELADQLIAAATESRRLNSVVDDMDGVRWGIDPPAGMEIRSDDAALGIPLPDQIDEFVHHCGFYSPSEVNKMRAPKWLDCEMSGGEDEHVFNLRKFAPSPDARARADEIVAAYDEWTVAKEKKPHGYRAAKRAYNAAERIETEIEQKIHSIRATTITGMTAKARCAELYDFESGVAGCFMESIANDLLALSADTPATVRPAGTPLTAVRSPALEAIERYHRASKRLTRCYDKLEKARNAAKEEHGRSPIALIHWRDFYIGGSELEHTRKTFVKRGEDAATIDSEYRDAKKRYRAQVKAVKDWEKRAGVDGLCKSLEQARSEFYAAREAVGVVKVQSVADASALIKWLRPEVKHGDIQPWEFAALNNASKFLSQAVA